MTSSTTYDIVNTHYSSLAREKPIKNSAHIDKVALSFGYNAEDLAAIPDGANLGVSCGNPIALAGLKEGETVIDLGSGAGFDVFQAARKVGETGKAIGIDMSEDMHARATANATRAGITNTEFILSLITRIALPSETADCIISNCVINLVPHADKHLVFNEIFRLLKPGGRVAVSDILAKKELTEEIRGDVALFVGCIAGAAEVSEYETWLKEAGFEDVMIVNKMNDLNIYKETDAEEQGASCCLSDRVCCGAQTSDEKEETKAESEKRIAEIDLNDWVGSFAIYAVKPF